MIIKALTLENFKGIKRPVRIEFKPITLLFGPNSAGKSTILQALVYAREILERHNLDPDRTVLGGEWMDLGGFHSLINNHQKNADIVIGFELNLSERGVSDYLSDNENFVLESSEHQRLPSEWLDNVQQAAFKLSICWSHLLNRPVVQKLSVEINYQDLAVITSTKDTKNIIIDTINVTHPIFKQFSLDDEIDGNWFADELLESGINPEYRGKPFSDHSPDFNFDEVQADKLSFLELLKEEKGEEYEIDETELMFDQDYSEHIDYLNTLKTFDENSVFKNIGLLGQNDALPVMGKLLQLDANIWRSSGDSFSPYSNHPLAAQLLISSVLSGLVVGPLDILSAELDKMLYIGPFREVPKRKHDPVKSPDLSRWARGLAAWDILLSDTGTLVERTNDWLESDNKFNAKYRVESNHFKLIDMSGPLYQALTNEKNINEDDFLSELFNQYLSEAPERKELKILSTDTGTRLEPADLGVGISQVIPVIVAALNTKSGLVAIEQPELHIHPAWQTVLGDLFISATKERGSMFLIETHSEHLMLRIVRRIRETYEKELPPGAPSFSNDMVSVLYVKGTDIGTSITPLPLRFDGEFEARWPDGFFEERDDELF